MLNNAIALIAVAALFGVEAIKVKERLPRIIFAAIAVFFALWAILVERIANAWPKVGAFVTGTFEQPVSWFVLAVALFFVLRPFWQRTTNRNGGSSTLSHLDHPPQPYDDTDLREKVDSNTEILAAFARDAQGINSRIAEVEGLNKTIIQDYQTVLGKLAEAEDRLAAHKDHMADCYSAEDQARRDGLGALNTELQSIRNGCADLQEKIDTLFMALQALKAFEIEGKLAAALSAEYEFLIHRVSEKLPVKGNDWIEWRARHTTFESALEQWTDLAMKWVPNVDRALQDARPSELTALDWDGLDDLFEGSNAVISYRSFAVKFARWTTFRSHLLVTLNLAAFGGHEAAKQVRQRGLAALFSGGEGSQ
jgi:hypothetical protein